MQQIQPWQMKSMYAIARSLGLDNPFSWLSMDQGRTVIDFLDRLATSAEKKALREGRVRHG